MKIQSCRICKGGFKHEFTLREMMFGLRDEFVYGECSNCGAVQILEVPADIEKYYPPYYYSFTIQVPILKRLPLLKRLVANIRTIRKYRQPDNSLLKLLKPVRTMPGDRILDIGCGKGALLCSLYNMGFENVSGVDKYLPNELDYGNRVKVYKKDLEELKENTYDLVMMHHVLEHVDNQVQELEECYRILKKGGALIIRIPVIGAAWKQYGRDWVQLDAPRHFMIHTLKSMAILAAETGFTMGETIFDSTDFQFWGSELYRMDIPLILPDTYGPYPYKQKFTSGQLLKFEVDAKALNTKQEGDQAIFYLYKE